jgi:riboflavin kinase / FMN adenylyltransferase
VLGFPTANLMPVDELIPKKGVYAVMAELANQEYYGVCNIGNNPTFGENALSIETFLLYYDGVTLGKDLTVRFIHRLRDEVTFAGPAELSEQIATDIKQAKELFGIHG